MTSLILVTGGTGTLGRHSCRACWRRAAGYGYSAGMLTRRRTASST